MSGSETVGRSWRTEKDRDLRVAHITDEMIAVPAGTRVTCIGIVDGDRRFITEAGHTFWWTLDPEFYWYPLSALELLALEAE